MTRYNIFVLWLDGTWSVFSAECDSIDRYVWNYRLQNIGKITTVFYERRFL